MDDEEEGEDSKGWEEEEEEEEELKEDEEGVEDSESLGTLLPDAPNWQQPITAFFAPRRAHCSR